MSPPTEPAALGEPAPRIQFSRVGRSFGANVALQSVDLAVYPGQFIALVGESGCGKTTTLKMINRLLEPDRGEVLIDGQSTHTQPPHLLRRRIGYVFQRIGLFPHLTVAENIGITPRLLGWHDGAHRVARRRAVGTRAPRLPNSRAGIRPRYRADSGREWAWRALSLRARASCSWTSRFGALDPVTRDDLGTEYRKLHDDLQLTTVMVTHDVAEAVLLADRIVVMRHGTIAAAGTARELMSNTDDGVRRLLDMPRRQALRVAALLDGARSQ